LDFVHLWHCSGVISTMGFISFTKPMVNWEEREGCYIHFDLVNTSLQSTEINFIFSVGFDGRSYFCFTISELKFLSQKFESHLDKVSFWLEVLVYSCQHFQPWQTWCALLVALYVFFFCSSCEFHHVVVILFWCTYAKSLHSRLSCVKLSTKALYCIFVSATIKSERKKRLSKFESLYKQRANSFLIACLYWAFKQKHLEIKGLFTCFKKMQKCQN
jgi:hypothetical protein